MTTNTHEPERGGRRLSPADVRGAQLSRATMLRPGYSDVEVDRFLDRVAEELARLHADKAELRDQVRALQEQVAGAAAQEAPSDQAVRILAVAQQTADSYVAEAEDFSRQMTADARAQYEEQVRRARENAGAIIQAAQEAAARMTAGERPAAADAPPRSAQELEDQVAYLKAFGQACRTQLRAYLEALLVDVEAEWGRADPGALPPVPRSSRVQPGTPTGTRPPPEPNVAREVPPADSRDADEVAGTDQDSGATRTAR
ncbi:DivIVA domain-containing protein [Geodermatophilus obscurus]|uniref:Cell wall synthesis protein Wag31 n=1 Tax=Geodermatophilus obscurus TaxID=1861 RepID=A0A1M7S963_9ACTN|nr:DivIVA domain-containing protein [Geodermatophilus obscurus]SHN55016.1 DivIVA domain-containing protein [Geodermatophilus obscurus]